MGRPTTKKSGAKAIKKSETRPKASRQTQTSERRGPDNITPEAKYADGPHYEQNIKPLIYEHSDFLNERELQKYFVEHVNDILEDKVLTINEEVSLPPNRCRKQSKFRIDIVAVAEEKHYIVECKAVAENGVTALISGVAQLQLYGVVYEHLMKIKPTLIIACNKINEYLSMYMAKYAPDVVLLIIGRTYTVSYQNGKA